MSEKKNISFSINGHKKDFEVAADPHSRQDFCASRKLFPERVQDLHRVRLYGAAQKESSGDKGQLLQELFRRVHRAVQHEAKGAFCVLVSTQQHHGLLEVRVDQGHSGNNQVTGFELGIHRYRGRRAV